ncbi:MAG: protease inhibitor I42 family protein [Fimbriimonadaceae bacterium]|nr:protease inhibitor I42 family protein [Fimbriimonadaceae bacterium]
MNTLLLSPGQAASVALSSGDEVALQVSENPTTGYRWELLLPDAGSASLSRTEFSVGAGALGAAGGRTFVVRAGRPGTHTLCLALRRSWQPDVVRERIQVEMVVG